ncbi:flagellar basal body rod protein FlgB [Maricaulis salignorans]|uniref:Flagellar basal body rod protein FlgB n=1 Tax=Maricaulis salignorans TaxID=144026 RepID=A0A1G9VIE2_9PROT|nr:flagellar basal body rod protein FlgB [Maricaulis salignorans]SDM71886.1 flagellar basal-body rod protein FlgB [Maricaulis salignorans]
MRPEDVPVLGLLTQSMNFHNQRQRVIAENVANANTPGYVAQDLDEGEFQRSLREQMQARSAARSTQGTLPALTSPTRQWQTQDAPDSETTVNGNTVVLEEQMMRANENRMEYESALSLYQKSLGMIRTAIRQAGR